jgi:hypothetical protein
MHLTILSYSWLKQAVGEFDLNTESFRSLLRSEITKKDPQSSQDDFYEKAICSWTKTTKE